MINNNFGYLKICELIMTLLKKVFEKSFYYKPFPPPLAEMIIHNLSNLFIHFSKIYIHFE